MTRLRDSVLCALWVVAGAACSSDRDEDVSAPSTPEPRGPQGPAPLILDRVVEITPSDDQVVRRSRDNHSRRIWDRAGPFPLHLNPSPDCHLLVAAAYAQTPGELQQPRPQAPRSLGVRLRQGDHEQIIEGRLLPPEGSGDRPWYRARVDLSGAPAGEVRAEILIDGQALSIGSPWQLSPPLLYQSRDPNPAHLNVLVITVDTLRADYLGAYGCEYGTTPRLDAFMDSSLRFSRCIAQSSWTLPSYSSMLTGLYAEAHRVVHRTLQLHPGFSTFPEYFAAEGYTTGAVVSGTFTDNLWSFDQGFDSYDDLGMITDDNRSLEGDPTDGEQMKGAEKRVTSDEITDKTLRWLRENKEHRFLFFAHYFDPHSDLVSHAGITDDIPRRPHRQRLPINTRNRQPEKNPVELKRLYEGEVRYTDQHIGRLLDGLEDLGLADSTIVVFCADHGEEFFERSQIGHGHGVFNELVHVPLAIRVPLPGYSPGKVATTPVANVDLGPTLMELCDIPFKGLSWTDPRDQQRQDLGGLSLVPVLRDPTKARGAPVLTVRYPATIPAAAIEAGLEILPPDMFRIDEDDLTLIDWIRPQGRILSFVFDSAADPFQTKNIAREQLTLAQALRAERFAQKARLEEYAKALKKSGVVDTTDVQGALQALGYMGSDEKIEIDDDALPASNEPSEASSELDRDRDAKRSSNPTSDQKTAPRPDDS